MRPWQAEQEASVRVDSSKRFRFEMFGGHVLDRRRDEVRRRDDRGAEHLVQDQQAAADRVGLVAVGVPGE